MGFEQDHDDDKDKKSAKKIENKIYRFYSAKQEKTMLEKKIEFSQATIKQTIEDISASRIMLASDIQGVRYDLDKGSPNLYQQSPQERSIDLAFQRLDHVVDQCEKDILFSKTKIAELNNLISTVEVVLNELEQDEVKFVEEKYKLKNTMRAIARELNISETGLFRFKDRLLKKIEDYLKLF